MAWIVDTISMHRNGEFIPGLVTGKPILLGGSVGARDGHGPRRGFFCTLEALAHLKAKLEGATVAIQGFGNAGSYYAQFVHEAGAKVIAVSDSRGGIYNSKGLDPKRSSISRRRRARSWASRAQRRSPTKSSWS
jgi:glutamate dehydrogenase/leucine dehydrogenase